MDAPGSPRPMRDECPDLAIARTGGHECWNPLRGLNIGRSSGGAAPDGVRTPPPAPPHPAAGGTRRRAVADARPPHWAWPPDAASPRDGPTARPPSCRCASADFRRLLVLCTSPSLDGGLPLLWLSLAKRARSSCNCAVSAATCSWSTAFSAFRAAISSAGVMPLRCTCGASPAE
jgi:hypothetical protein